MRFVNLSGKKFGRLLVQSRAGSDKHQKATWNCLCDCGNYLVLESGSLNSGNTISCGCFRKEVTQARSTTHGHKKDGVITGEYEAWHGLVKRCTNPNTKYYHNYGGRGIKVCDRWLSSFENFLEDMGEKPTSKHSIERNEVNGNYEPDNCRWATANEQAWNKRLSVINTSGVMGVHWNKRDKRWVVRITVNKKVIILGNFKDFEEAKQSRIEAEIKYWNKQPS